MFTISPVTEKERAAKGAARLDQHGVTNWYNRVNLKTLDISSVVRCVCGQVYGEYTLGIKALGLETYQGYEYGFSGQTKEVIDAWKDEILARRAASVPTEEKVLELV